jgi:hypothetical protein
MYDQRRAGIQRIIRRLLPSVSVTEEVVSEQELRARFPGWKGNYNKISGVILNNHLINLWLKDKINEICVINIRRESLDLTKNERSVFNSFPKTMEGFFPDAEDRAGQTSGKIASRYAFGNILIARHLRGYTAANFWTQALIISELQELSLRRYEGQPCSSGVICVSEISEYIQKIDQALYRLDLFDDEIFIEEGFFENAASYRYVDGRNSFYLIDHWRRIYGVVRIRNPSQFSLVDRADLRHITPLFRPNNGRVAAYYIGRNDDVNIITRKLVHFKWHKLYWHILDRNILFSMLTQFGLMDLEAKLLIATLLAVSELRFGALVLVASKVGQHPIRVGKIDTSRLSVALYQSTERKRISELANEHAAVGVLSSDGLTTISLEGVIVSTGDIIDVRNDENNTNAGGGRTQAAIAASQFGLAIKVSEDGPLTLYRNGAKILELNF